MNIGIIGTGNRATAYYNIEKYDKDTKIIALCDIDTTKANKVMNKFFNGRKDIKIYDNYLMLVNDTTIDSVIICTPDYTHKEIALELVKSGKHILIEKPVATTIDDLEALYKNCIDYNKTLLPGFVLRYTQLYKKVKQLIKEKVVGDIITIEANETLSPVHAASFFRRWHKDSITNGGFLNAKCSHDIDLLNMMISKKPLYVSSFGSNTHFIKENGIATNCSRCPKKDNCIYVDNANNEFSGIAYDICPYMVESDIVDHQIVNIEYENNITANFTVSMHGEKGNREMTIYGTKGIIKTDFSKQEIYIGFNNSKKEQIIKLNNKTEGHGGGDINISEVFIKEEINEIYNGILSTSIALAAEKSRKEKVVINMKKFVPFIF